MLGRRKNNLLALVIGCVVAVILFQRGVLPFFYDHNVPSEKNQALSHAEIPSSKSSRKNIPCRINWDTRKNIGLPQKNNQVRCLMEESEVYVPFTFLKKYFDVYGVVGGNDGGAPYFSWSHSYSKVFPHLKNHQYDPGSSYLQFSSFDVENRPRVKCVSARYSVPITVQWDKDGYYYVTQICQYALSHWSKATLDQEDEEVVLLEDGNNTYGNAAWSNQDVNRITRDNCVHFDSPQTLEFPVNHPGLLILSFDLLIRDKPSVTVTMGNQEFGKYLIQYSPDPTTDIRRSARTIRLGYDIPKHPIKEGTWKSFTRNLLNDLTKGLGNDASAKSIKASKHPWSIESLAVEGVGCITNISLAKTRHMRMFFHAADWLVDTQNQRSGAWHVSVPFNAKKSKYPLASEISPGWISGMGSGHAMSVLTRAFRRSKEPHYLESAIKALQPFKKASHQGGVQALFMGKYLWFEEYPTNPSSFVLNGFMYSLVGIYDLWQTLREFAASDSHEAMADAQSHFEEGLKSLVSMLPLYDTGSGTTYDLRHITMGGAPKLARWDYHSTHINLLYLLSTIASDSNQAVRLTSTADRWLGYMVGQRAEHN